MSISVIGNTTFRYLKCDYENIINDLSNNESISNFFKGSNADRYEGLLQLMLGTLCL